MKKSFTQLKSHSFLTVRLHKKYVIKIFLNIQIKKIHINPTGRSAPIYIFPIYKKKIDKLEKSFSHHGHNSKRETSEKAVQHTKL